MTVDTEDAQYIRDNLERLTRGVAKMVNEKDFDFRSASAQEVRSHLSPDLMYQGWEEAQAIPFERQRSAWKVQAVVNPHTYFQVLEVSSTITEHLGRASVFMVLLLTGTLGIRLQIYTEFKWRREAGQWKCYWVNGGQGMPEPNLGPIR